MNTSKQSFDPKARLCIHAEYTLDEWSPNFQLPGEWIKHVSPHDYEWAEDWWSEPPKWQKPFRRSEIPPGALITTNPQFLKL